MTERNGKFVWPRVSKDLKVACSPSHTPSDSSRTSQDKPYTGLRHHLPDKRAANKLVGAYFLAVHHVVKILHKHAFEALSGGSGSKLAGRQSLFHRPNCKCSRQCSLALCPGRWSRSEHGWQFIKIISATPFEWGLSPYTVELSFRPSCFLFLAVSFIRSQQQARLLRIPLIESRLGPQQKI